MNLFCIIEHKIHEFVESTELSFHPHFCVIKQPYLEPCFLVIFENINEKPFYF